MENVYPEPEDNVQQACHGVQRSNKGSEECLKWPCQCGFVYERP